jgi:hypothetical protein
MMKAKASSQMIDHEGTLVEIVRTLPLERIAQLVDFARFLEAQTLVEELAGAESMAEIEAENAKWDALLATEEAQDMLDKLADEALKEHQAGQSRPMRFTEGRMGLS